MQPVHYHLMLVIFYRYRRCLLPGTGYECVYPSIIDAAQLNAIQLLHTYLTITTLGVINTTDLSLAEARSILKC